jgi:hypothetical protein
MRRRLRTDDGWTVEVVVLDGVQWLEVKHHGFLAGGSGRNLGLVRTVEEVEQIMARRLHG